MDKQNLSDLEAMQGSHYHGELKLFLGYADNLDTLEVPDPYYGKGDGFERVLKLVERASDGLLDYIIAKHSLRQDSN